MSTPVRTPVANATCRVKFRDERPRGQTPPSEKPSERVPGVARLLALAHRIDGMIRSGELKDWAEAARLIGVTRARMTQIGNLLLLSPGIQEDVLTVAPTRAGCAVLTEHHLRAITISIHWREQDSAWMLNI